MNSRQRVMAALHLKEPDRVPIMDFVDTVVKQKIMGTQKIDEVELAQKIGMDAIYFVNYATPLFCQSHYGKEDDAKAYGMTGETEFIGEGLIRSDKDLDKIVLPDPHDESFYDPAKQFMEQYHDSDLAIYAGLRPFGMFNTIYSMPMMDFAVALGDNIQLINTMMDIFIDWNLVILEKLQGLGINFIVAYNDMAYKEGPLVSPQVFREVFLPKMTTKFNILVLNGPNLNMLGKREPEIYGSLSLTEIMTNMQAIANDTNIGLDHCQSNAEHILIDKIHQSFQKVDFIIINPAAFTHTSVAIRDALLAVNIPFIEVHLSNVHSREAFRQHSYLSDIAIGVISGLGANGYEYALNAAISHLKKKN